jgi:hypothetical protein
MRSGTRVVASLPSSDQQAACPVDNGQPLFHPGVEPLLAPLQHCSFPEIQTPKGCFQERSDRTRKPCWRCTDRSVTVIGSQKPDFWKHELWVSVKYPSKGWGTRKILALMEKMSFWVCVCERDRETESLYVYEYVCVCVCVWERERERERESICMCMSMCGWPRARERKTICVCVCMSMCMRESISMCISMGEWVSVCVCERETESLSVCVWVCVSAYECVYERERERGRERERENLYVYECMYIKNRTFPSFWHLFSFHALQILASHRKWPCSTRKRDRISNVAERLHCWEVQWLCSLHDFDSLKKCLSLGLKETT